MHISRRAAVRLFTGAMIYALAPLQALAALLRPQAAFDATSTAAAFAGLGGEPADSSEIDLETPDIAENGAVVPVGVTSRIPDTAKISIIVEKNPNPLSAMFLIPAGTEPFVQTRVKVAQTCVIYAVVEANGKLYKAARETKVTLGGCGG